MSEELNHKHSLNLCMIKRLREGLRTPCKSLLSVAKLSRNPFIIALTKQQDKRN